MFNLYNDSQLRILNSHEKNREYKNTDSFHIGIFVYIGSFMFD